MQDISTLVDTLRGTRNWTSENWPVMSLESAHLMFDAAQVLERIHKENEALKEHLKRARIADMIVQSEQFMWLMAGSNHVQSNLDDLKPAYKLWKESGGTTLLKMSNEHLDNLAKLDQELGLI